VQEQNRVPNGFGGFDETWSDKFSGHCLFTAITGWERLQSTRLEAQARWKIQMRYVPGLVEKHRISANDRFYDIVFVENIEYRNRFYNVYVTAGAAS